MAKKFKCPRPINRLVMHRAGSPNGPFFQNIGGPACIKGVGNFVGEGKPGSRPIALRGYVRASNLIDVVWSKAVELDGGVVLPNGMEIWLDDTSTLIQVVSFIDLNTIMRIQILGDVLISDVVVWEYTPPGVNGVESGEDVGLQQSLTILNDFYVIAYYPRATLIPGGIANSSPSFLRASTATVVDFESRVLDCLVDEARFQNARRVENLATGLVTETITVISGSEYQVTINGANGDTAVFSGAFTGTLTADGASRISWPNGIPKIAATTSLTITITGTLTELLVEDVTGQAIRVPSEYFLNGGDHGSGVDGVKYFYYKNGNTVDVNGVVTEAKGASISGITLLKEDAATNVNYDSFNFEASIAWGSQQAVLTDASAVSPDSTLNATRLQADGTTAGHLMFISNITPIGVEATISIYAKADDAKIVHLFAAGSNVWTQWDLLTGDLLYSGAGTGTLVDYGAEEMGNGWWRVWMSVITNNGLIRIYSLETPNNSPTPVETSSAGLWLWGAQTETGNKPTSYIPTVSAATTRAADGPLSYSNVPVENETRVVVDGAASDTDDWDGVVDEVGDIQSVGVYQTGDRPVI